MSEPPQQRQLATLPSKHGRTERLAKSALTDQGMQGSPDHERTAGSDLPDDGRQAADVSVIIATTLDANRIYVLRRAVQSVMTQTGCRPVVLLIVNGTRYDSEELKYWSSHQGVDVHQLPIGDVQKARLYGRDQVRTAYFSFLDDDDEYLPGGLATRLVCMMGTPRPDVVVANGLIEQQGETRTALTQIDAHQRNPLRSLASENWLPSAAAVFRTSRIGRDFFAYDDPLMEWTALAFRLAVAGMTIEFIEALTYKINDSPVSLSKSAAYATGVSETLRRLVALDVPSDVAPIWDAKYREALHALADHYRTQGNWREAWRAHIQTLCQRGGLRYASYTRHLLLMRR